MEQASSEQVFSRQMFSRQRALDLLEEWTKGQSLRKHGRAVAACTEFYGSLEAEHLGLVEREAQELIDLYAAAGLLHDMDYERYPSLDDHPFVGVEFLRKEGWPEVILHAILAHADYAGVPRESHLDRALFACDELAGLITACALVKPTKSVMDVDVKSVLKKMKDKAFARTINREDVIAGAALLNLCIEEHVGNCLAAMQAHAVELELQGIEAS